MATVPHEDPREAVRRLLEKLPETASLEDIQYHIYVKQKVERGIWELEAGKVLSEEEFDRKFGKWLAE